MNNSTRIEELAEETLSSIDNIQQAEVNDFMFTRIKSRMEAKRMAAIQAKVRLMPRLSAALLLFVIINLTSFYLLKQQSRPTAPKTINGIAAFADDYKLTDSSYTY